jgi:hypothetical protein
LAGVEVENAMKTIGVVIEILGGPLGEGELTHVRANGDAGVIHTSSDKTRNVVTSGGQFEEALLQSAGKIVAVIVSCYMCIL